MSIVGTRPPLISETNLYEPRHKVRLEKYDSFVITEKTDYSAEAKGEKTYYMKQVNRREKDFIWRMIQNAWKSIGIYRKEKGKVHYIYGELRFGGAGSRLDNSAAGGDWVLINKDGLIQNEFYKFDKTTTDTICMQSLRLVVSWVGIIMLCVSAMATPTLLVLSLARIRLSYRW